MLSVDVEQKPKRKIIISTEKAQLERERRGKSLYNWERLRELVPVAQDNKKVTMRKIVDEATAYLRRKTSVPSISDRKTEVHLLGGEN